MTAIIGILPNRPDPKPSSKCTLTLVFKASMGYDVKVAIQLCHRIDNKIS